MAMVYFNCTKNRQYIKNIIRVFPNVTTLIQGLSYYSTHFFDSHMGRFFNNVPLLISSAISKVDMSFWNRNTPYVFCLVQFNGNVKQH